MKTETFKVKDFEMNLGDGDSEGQWFETIAQMDLLITVEDLGPKEYGKVLSVEVENMATFKVNQDGGSGDGDRDELKTKEQNNLEQYIKDNFDPNFPDKLKDLL